jgi:DNA topoisomerase I
MAAAKNGRTLVIVESPAKARTIGKYLGRGFEVDASVGHVKDLPKKDLGVDVDGDFTPKWVVMRGKGKVLNALRRKAKGAKAVILATDPDREGEAIAWHVADELGFEKSPERFQRVEFREITKQAVDQALRNPGRLDMHKVEAQQARRILDRLVGYQASPFLWKPIRPGLSAGRVQTVALRLISEREEEIRRFEAEEYWSITAHLQKGEVFLARLRKIDGEDLSLGDADGAKGVVEDLEDVPFVVTGVERKERRRNPFPPFTTSTLQQEAARRLRFPARMTMSTAQRLYEGVDLGSRGTVGLITYMRTDSTRVSAGSASTAQRWIGEEFGKQYVKGRLWGGKKQKGAQEAHEAIRPTDPTLTPEMAGRFLSGPQARLYDLIWRRFVASQMAPSIHDTTTIDFAVTGASGRRYDFRANGSVLRFDGFTRIYPVKSSEDLLPELDEGETAELRFLEPKQHFTQPPPRFSEATLVKELEKQGIGRPSTYAQILSTIQDRGYVELEERRFVPTPLGDTVVQLLVRVFPDLFDVAFTSRMEGELDRVEEGEVGWRELLRDFYPGFRKRLEEGKAASDEMIREILRAEGETCEKCGEPMMVKWNRHGRFLGCSAYPECRSTRSMDGERDDDTELGTDPESGLPVFLRDGPYGPYVQLGEGEDGKKPPRCSLPDGVEEVELELALRLLSLPRVIGVHEGKEVRAGLGRYGPYVQREGTFRSLKTFEELFTISLEEALELLATRKGPPVLKELGTHRDVELRILDGRYGPYVTDGKKNASLPKGMKPEGVDLKTGVELLAKKKARKRRG